MAWRTRAAVNTLVLAMVASSGVAQECVVWRQKVAEGTTARSGHGLAYFGFPEEIVLLIGGTADETPKTVDAWDGWQWTPHSDFATQLRTGHTVGSYRIGGSRAVVFGGWDGKQILGDTWTWNGSAWIERAPNATPSPRMDHAMGSQEIDGSRSIMFGGWDGAQFLGDSWRWWGGNWEKVASDGPSARAQHAMASFRPYGVIVLFGGWDGENTLGDTWEWDYHNLTWTLLDDIGQSPPPRKGHAMAYCELLDRLILFGGRDQDGNLLDDTWMFDGERWQQLDIPGPSMREEHAMASAYRDGLIVLTGGRDENGELADTWELLNPADYDRDRFLGTADLRLFLLDWSDGHPRTDMNTDGVVDTLDLIEFLRFWNESC